MSATSTLPKCPTCGSEDRRCYRPSGHEAAQWHDDRETALAQACRCPDVCTPWLAAHAPQDPTEVSP